ncbi:hypothetical protein [Chromobacterium amazonense]|nr:hypothetical protein [Chromobacterium amazonense]
MKQSNRWLGGLALALALTGCGTLKAAESSDPYLRKGIRMNVASMNYVNRAVHFRIDDGYNSGGIANAGSPNDPWMGGPSTCCFTITDLNKPFKIEAKWVPIREDSVMGPDGDYIRGKVLVPEETKVIFAKLPQRPPKVLKGDPMNSEDAVCVIFKSMDVVELKYSEFGCKQRVD